MLMEMIEVCSSVVLVLEMNLETMLKSITVNIILEKKYYNNYNNNNNNTNGECTKSKPPSFGNTIQKL